MMRCSTILARLARHLDDRWPKHFHTDRIGRMKAVCGVSATRRGRRRVAAKRVLAAGVAVGATIVGAALAPGGASADPSINGGPVVGLVGDGSNAHPYTMTQCEGGDGTSCTASFPNVGWLGAWTNGF